MEARALPGMEELAVDADESNPFWEAQRKSALARAIFEMQEGANFASMDAYWDLVGRGWGWRQAVYIVWLALPDGRRVPQTQQELATSILGLTSDRQLRNWRDGNPAIQAEVVKVIREKFFWAVPRVMDALIESAATPDGRNHADRVTFFEMTGFELGRGRALPDDLSGLSDEELMLLASGEERADAGASAREGDLEADGDG